MAKWESTVSNIENRKPKAESLFLEFLNLPLHSPVAGENRREVDDVDDPRSGIGSEKIRVAGHRALPGLPIEVFEIAAGWVGSSINERMA